MHSIAYILELIFVQILRLVNIISADSKVGLILHQRMCTGATKGPKYDYLTSPTYLVGLDMLKADPQSYESFLAGRNGRWWKKCFSLSLAISNLRQKPFPVDGPFLHGNDGRIEIYGNWNRQSSYFQSRNRKLVCSLFLDYSLDSYA